MSESAENPGVLPYGSWPTPITSALVVRAARIPSEALISAGEVYWAEVRPDEGGRTQLVRWSPEGGSVGLLPAGVNARTAVHEYGGGAWWAHERAVWFVDWADQRLYRRSADGTIRPVTPAPEHPRGERWADGCVHPDGTVMAVVRERHPAGDAPAEVVNELVTLPVEGGEPEVVVTGPDFVSDPRWSPDGGMLCWLEWDHPDMPWDATRLRVRSGSEDLGVVAGGVEESVLEPRWAPDGALWFVSDRNGWWNLYRRRGGSGASAGVVEPMVELAGDIGTAKMVFNQSRYAFLADGSVVFAYTHEGFDRLGLRRPEGTLTDLDLGLAPLESVRAEGGTVVFTAASPTREPTVLRCVLAGDRVDAVTELAPPRDLGLPTDWFSPAEHVAFPTSDGHTAYALYHPPRNPGYRGPEGERPPLLVRVHGGPTSAARGMLDLTVQYWTSRGFAVADVNYRGSTGYGRAFREQLNGRWGVVDVDDCVAAAAFLAEQDRVDGDRMCIRGGSAGGFTTLAALAFREVFAAGASHYGVADLEALARDTHKFESRYLDGLVGPLPSRRDLYRARSPIHHVGGFETPLAVFQGLEDAVVPPAQSEMIVEALRAKGVPVAYLAFAGEQHGFRQAANLRRALDGELSFYSQVLGFALPPEEDVEPLPVEGL